MTSKGCTKLAVVAAAAMAASVIAWAPGARANPLFQCVGVAPPYQGCCCEYDPFTETVNAYYTDRSPTQFSGIVELQRASDGALWDDEFMTPYPGGGGTFGPTECDPNAPGSGFDVSNAPNDTYQLEFADYPGFTPIVTTTTFVVDHTIPAVKFDSASFNSDFTEGFVQFSWVHLPPDTASGSVSIYERTNTGPVFVNQIVEGPSTAGSDVITITPDQVIVNPVYFLEFEACNSTPSCVTADSDDFIL
jgi:hypothetical protein